MDKTKPSHYRNSVIQPVDIWKDWGLEPDASVATCIKYLKRAGTKAGESSGDDYLKAIWFLVNAVTGETQVADEVCFLESGNIVERGTAEQVLHNPQNPKTQEFLKRVHQAGRL